MPKTWFTGDFHFGHKNGTRPELFGRDFPSTHEMDQAIIEAHNAVVSREDTVYFLGDFACNVQKKQLMSRYVNLLEMLNYREWHWIIGNHDRASCIDTLKEAGLISTYGHYAEVKIDKQLIVLCHYPFRSWNQRQYGSWHIHGHSHGRLEKWPGMLDAGIDAAHDGRGKYQPISLELARELILPP